MRFIIRQRNIFMVAGGSMSSSLGTVGAVAVDEYGRLAAASSTGGMSGKLSGRVGDSCIAGAGFYADRNVAVTGTGNGDVFIRKQICIRVAQLLAFNEKLTLNQACRQILDEHMVECGAGLIAVDSCRQISMVFNTSDMYRGYALSEDEIEVFFEK